ncbi:DegT/DnrJ/EryC1/StrS family aminotransferase [candidate division KSB1 bacterium]|nr:DegT/DnrJ/EryC1/StrS family aminotransferase [candidate division KSB1 bacterium]
MGSLAINGGSPVRTAPFQKWPVWNEDEIKGLEEVIRSGKWGRIHGKKVEDFENHFAEYHDAKFGVCVNSGTTALQIALRAAGIGAGDEVILPGYTFIATATAALEAGAIPIMIDIDPETYNIDVKQIEANITPKTRGIMPVHFGGRPADMDAINAIARKHNLKVIEDAAQAWGSAWNGTKVGALGTAGCFSFQSSKNVNAGEGGIILTNDAETEKFARSFSNCGRLPNGVWYEHYYLGGNYRMTEFQGAVLQAQFARYPEMQATREKNANLLSQHLKEIEGVELLKDDPKITRNSRHLFIWRYKKEGFNNVPKAKFLDAMKAEGVFMSAGYSIPLYSQPLMKEKTFGPAGKVVDIPIDFANMNLPETERACYDEAVWIVQSPLLGTEQDMMDMIKAIKKVQEHSSELK